MAGAHPAIWFGFGFCGFGQVPGSGSGLQVLRPERLLDADICRVSAGWSYTAVLNRAGRLQLSGSADGAAGGCTDVWASEDLLVLLRSRPGPGPRTELQAWEPGAALRGDPRWTRLLEDDSESDDGGGGDGQRGPLPLLPGARAYVSPRPPHYRPLGPELRARRLELGAEHALLLDVTGQVFSWGAGRHGQLGHGTLEPAPEPRLLEALQGLSMAAVAAGGWHSVCVSESGDLYVWGWNEAGQLGLPARGLGEPQVAKAPSPGGDTAAKDRTEVDTAPYIAVQPFPALLDLPSSSDVVAASCGSRHTAAITRTGELYSWGWGKYGQLGHANTTSLDRPCRVRYFEEQRLRVLAVSCGPWSTFVCAEEEQRAAP